MAEVVPFETRFFCTFGGDRLHKYVEVECSDSAQAHEAMYAIFGLKWAFCYDRRKFQGQPELYGLQCIGVIYFTGDCGWQWDETKAGSYKRAG